MVTKRTIAPGIAVSPLALGTNVFGWTADTETSHAVLDGYVNGGGNFLDTADSYSFWAEGNSGGESETIIGKWLAGRSDRDDLVIATKVSHHPQFAGLAPETIRAAVDASLTRLDIDVIDIYYAHFDDPSTPLVESIAAMSELVDQGKVRCIGISNYTAERIEDWLKITADESFHAPMVIEPQYNLVERGIEADILPLARTHGLAVVPYYSLAHGFLTGKYTGEEDIESPRASDAQKYLTPQGRKVIDAVRAVAGEHATEPASVALAWLAAQEGVAAPIASARTTDQLSTLLDSLHLQLSDKELQLLDEASQP
ncbi:aldo/keto reductase [Pseudarthrobacter enclensis]|uniref:Aryl-alcohol dehydrogenase-like predicted oxidoreductase n=1 Tax=Pseudarthrobacter enclensis TaxID=993070 RepID=A0ABT9RUZ7_9MICC|nr:aldo/keto reductase [Pseudarthrobacter enclensis]MDP9889056.1 aryl-alcohol dehydrogenase-like predicted oxidoreductase [Pseudarthrobacter enclensis]